ncbi:MAG: acetyl-CoA carboxylase carboxyltransferase subunit beta [Candidatus Eisenbacteria bacterium]|uniref:Acetyl-coenzyme A carboxylase carboxyl transferase subunit beta n=1 Tax=Eiseniibacteriota bacterium TaxID=2212470 RepID=A0A849SPY8_UNCEI|nr:acetyl-CoA carboxylase carboxyltransferase subunit beta [Candidatus Eisenbacteria bacterium]
MSWLKRERTGIKGEKRDATQVPEGLWTKCEGCGEALFQTVLEEHQWTCPRCNFHFRVPALTYLEYLVDEDSFTERFDNLIAGDPLEFRDAKMRYPDRLAAAQLETGLRDAAIAGLATVGGIPVAVTLMDFFFMGGSMGSVVGEKVARTIELGLADRRAVIVVSATGGARMQEGILSLMQMAKTSALLSRLQDARIPFISILTDPSTAGVLASYASLGDVILAEPGALVGFAGARVIRQTIGEELPPGFQRAEFVLEKGFVDRVVHRKQMHDEVAQLLRLFWHSTHGFAPEGGTSPHPYDPALPEVSRDPVPSN